MKLRFSDKNRIFNIHTNGIPYLSIDMLDRLGVPNLYSTRFRTWNDERGEGAEALRTAVMKWETIEEASPVCRANRDALAQQIGSSIGMEVITDQKHTNYVHVAEKKDLGVATTGTYALHRQYVDGIVTDIPNALLTVFGADCPSVYIVDPVRKAIGLVHAGWKGTLGKIPLVAIAQMRVKFGCNPSDMYAAIGPGICVDCYEMGDEIYDAFAEQWSKEDADRLLKRYPPKENAAAPHSPTCSSRNSEIAIHEADKAETAIREAGNAETATREVSEEAHSLINNTGANNNVSTTSSGANNNFSTTSSGANNNVGSAIPGAALSESGISISSAGHNRETSADTAASACLGKYHLDLREANRLTLLRADIPASHIAVSNVCTMCNSDLFYSYRAKRMENEQVAMMVNLFNQ